LPDGVLGINSDGAELPAAEAQLARALARVVRLRAGEHASFDEVEQITLQAINEAGRIYLGRRLQQIADRQPQIFHFNGFRYRPHQPGTVGYHSLCGTLEIRRFTYRREGARNSATIVPLEIAAGIVERGTPAFSYCVAKGYAKTTSRDLHEDLVAAYRCPPSRTTLERMCTRIGAGVQQSLDEIEPLIRMEEDVPEDACAIAVGIDRTSVPMAEDRPDGEQPNSRRKRRTEPHRRKPPPPFDVNYRMAYIATVTLTNQHGEALQSRRYAVPAHEGPEDLVARAMADVRATLRQRPELHVGAIMDGAAELWGLIWDAFSKEPLITKYHQVIDRYHLNERLADGLRIAEPDPKKRHEKLSAWNTWLDKKNCAIFGIERELEDIYRRLPATKKKSFFHCLDYVSGFKYRMRYATMRKLGLPVGSGATEGACKSLVTARAKRSGQRWREPGISGVLALRSVHESDRLDAYWPRFVNWSTCAYLTRH
jgi:hypothetical protein